MPLPPKIQNILDEAEKKKKQADLEFARSKFQEAIETYSAAITILSPLRSTPFGELCALRCFSNQIQCYIKLDENEKAITTARFALTIPIATSEIHLTQKIFIRCAQALENLENYETALAVLDKAIAIDATSTTLDPIRERLIEKLNASDNIVPILPRPLEFPSSEVTKVIGEILKTRGDCDVIGPILNELFLRRVHLDRRDEKNYNIMWALCQAAVLRANQPTENADDVFPLLQLIILNGAAAEQRFLSNDPTKTDRTSNQTPLMLFAIAGAVDCVKFLIQSGASVVTCDNEGWIPLMVACIPSHPRVTEESLASGKPATNDEMVELLIDAKSPVNSQNFTGLTPLICASQSGDLQSAALLIHAGATINLRSANGFSPIVWAFSSKHPNHEMIQLLLDACITPITTEKEREEGKEDSMTSEQRQDLQKECLEDLKCYKMSQLSLNLKIIVKEFIVKYENTQKAVGKEVTRPPPYLLQRKLVESLAHLTGTVAEAGGSHEMTPKYLTTVSSLGLYSSLLSHLQTQIIPNSLFYQYRPIRNAQEAVMCAPLLEQAHLSILMRAATGETNEPLLCKAAHQDYLLCTRHVDYRMLICEPMVSIFSACVPSNDVLDLIVLEKNLVFVLSLGGDYWVKNILEKTQNSPITMKIVRSNCTSQTSTPLYFLDSQSTHIETTSTLATYSQPYTLVMIWPMCNMISTTSRELVEKDEELLLSFSGQRIFLLGDINYNPLNREPVVKEWITRNYECVETIPLLNWRDFQNTLTVWVKLT